MDTIYLSATIFTGIFGNVLGEQQFRVGTAALDSDDRIIFDYASGDIYYDRDGAGGAAQVQFANLYPNSTGWAPVLTASDFIMVT